MLKAETRSPTLMGQGVITNFIFDDTWKFMISEDLSYVDITQLAKDYDLLLTQWRSVTVINEILAHLDKQNLRSTYFCYDHQFLRIELLDLLLTDNFCSMLTPLIPEGITAELLDYKMSKTRKLMGYVSGSIDFSDDPMTASFKLEDVAREFHEGQFRQEIVVEANVKLSRGLSTEQITDLFVDLSESIPAFNTGISYWTVGCDISSLSLTTRVAMLEEALKYEAAIYSTNYRQFLIMHLIYSSDSRSKKS